jgi:hypothetical protein
MHAIEKAALEDPFLSDAIEGMQGSLGMQGSQSFTHDVNDLNERLQKKITQKRKITPIAPNLIWQRIAAAAVILIGSTLLIFYFVIKNAGKNLALASADQKLNSDSNIARNNAPSTAIKMDSTSVKALAREEKNKKEDSGKTRLKKYLAGKQEADKNASASRNTFSRVPQGERGNAVRTENLKDEAAIRKPATAIKTDSLSDESVHKQLASSNAPPASLEGKAAGISVQRNRPYNDNFVQGIVVDNYKNPVPGATVKLQNRKIGTSTDVNGYFKLKADNNGAMSNVIVNSVGFESANVFLRIQNDSPSLIQLQPATSPLDEVVVVGYAAKEPGDDNQDAAPTLPKKQKEISSKAEPSGGWPAFNDYINQNKKMATADSLKKGKEIISFLVDTAGGLSTFKIKKSLSPAHDAKAIRLIRQGPSWKLLKRKKAKVTLAIEF